MRSHPQSHEAGCARLGCRCQTLARSHPQSPGATPRPSALHALPRVGEWHPQVHTWLGNERRSPRTHHSCLRVTPSLPGPTLVYELCPRVHGASARYACRAHRAMTRQQASCWYSACDSSWRTVPKLVRSWCVSSISASHSCTGTPLVRPMSSVAAARQDLQASADCRPACPGPRALCSGQCAAGEQQVCKTTPTGCLIITSWRAGCNCPPGSRVAAALARTQGHYGLGSGAAQSVGARCGTGRAGRVCWWPATCAVSLPAPATALSGTRQPAQASTQVNVRPGAQHYRARSCRHASAPYCSSQQPGRPATAPRP